MTVMLAQQSQTPEEKDFVPVVKEPVNALYHQKILSEYILGLSPILADIVIEGIAQKKFKVPYPRETVEILLCAALVVFDEAYFHWTKEEQSSRVSVFIYTVERLLGTEPGTLSRIAELFAGG